MRRISTIAWQIAIGLAALAIWQWGWQLHETRLAELAARIEADEKAIVDLYVAKPEELPAPASTTPAPVAKPTPKPNPCRGRR